MRLLDWQIRLQCLLDQARHCDFVWGSVDCVHLAIKVIDALTGRKVMLPPYDTEGQAKLLLEGREFLTVLEQWMETLGYRMIIHHRRGDIVVIGTRAPWFYACGVIDLSGRRVGICGEKGLVFVPRRWITYGWAIE